MVNKREQGKATNKKQANAVVKAKTRAKKEKERREKERRGKRAAKKRKRCKDEVNNRNRDLESSSESSSSSLDEDEWEESNVVLAKGVSVHPLLAKQVSVSGSRITSHSILSRNSDLESSLLRRGATSQ